MRWNEWSRSSECAVGRWGGCVDDDVAHEGAVEEVFQAEVFVGVGWTGDGGTRVDVAVVCFSYRSGNAGMIPTETLSWTADPSSSEQERVKVVRTGWLPSPPNLVARGK